MSNLPALIMQRMADRQLYLLDTDHISLLQRGNANLRSRLLQIDVPNRCVTVISLAEQMQGRLAVIRRASSEIEAARGFQRLHETMTFYQSATVLLYDQQAAEEFNRLRAMRKSCVSARRICALLRLLSARMPCSSPATVEIFSRFPHCIL